MPPKKYPTYQRNLHTIDSIESNMLFFIVTKIAEKVTSTLDTEVLDETKRPISIYSENPLVAQARKNHMAKQLYQYQEFWYGNEDMVYLQEIITNL